MPDSNEHVIWRDPPAPTRRGRRGIDVSNFVAELKANPGKWGTFPHRVSSLTTGMRAAPEIEWRLTRSADQPNKYEVAGRYLELPSEDLKHQTTGEPAHDSPEPE